MGGREGREGRGAAAVSLARELYNFKTVANRKSCTAIFDRKDSRQALTSCSLSASKQFTDYSAGRKKTNTTWHSH